MNTAEIKALHEQYVIPTYAPGLALTEGTGCRVKDAEGRDYLDFLAGIAVTNIGHAHPRFTAAVSAQLSKLVHVSNLYFNEQQPRLAQALIQRAGLGGGKCFFCNSGAEANEGLIKLARLRGAPQGRYEVITMRNSFHGRTLATLTATGQDKVQKGFAPLPEGFRYAEFNDLDSVRAAVSEKTAAVLVEAVQGEGGVRPAAPEFMQGLRTLCTEKDLLLLCDEVQCGMGRTGNWFGFQAYAVRPDAFSLAKGLGNGYPIGAIVAGPAVQDVFQPGTHATTFGGTPLACAAALSVIEVLEQEQLLEHAQRMGACFCEGLCEIAVQHKQWVQEVRGLGLLIGLVLEVPALPLQQKLQEKGLLALATAGNVLRFLPPLTVGLTEIKEALEMLEAACAELHEELTAQAGGPCRCS